MHESVLTEGLQFAKTIKRTEQIHLLVLMTKSKSHAYILSLQGNSPDIVNVMDFGGMTEPPSNTYNEIKQQSNIFAKMMMRLIEDTSERNCTTTCALKILINRDTCWITESNVPCVKGTPLLAPSGRSAL